MTTLTTTVDTPGSRIRLAVTQRTIIEGVLAEVNSVVTIDTERQVAIVSAHMPYSPGALARLLRGGAVRPLNISRSEALDALEPPNADRSVIPIGPRLDISR